MVALKCEMCGNSSLTKENGFFICDFCGTKYSTEEAKNLLLWDGEIKGPVKIDHLSEIDNKFANAKRLYERGDGEKAYDIFVDILNADPQNSKALLYAGLSLGKQKDSTRKPLDNAIVYFDDAFKAMHEQAGESAEFFAFSAEAFSKIRDMLQENYQARIEKLTDLENTQLQQNVEYSNSILDSIGYSIQSKTELSTANANMQGAIRFLADKVIDRFSALQITSYHEAPESFFASVIEFFKFRYFGNFDNSSIWENDKKSLAPLLKTENATIKDFYDSEEAKISKQTINNLKTKKTNLKGGLAGGLFLMYMSVLLLGACIETKYLENGFLLLAIFGIIVSATIISIMIAKIRKTKNAIKYYESKENNQ